MKKLFAVMLAVLLVIPMTLTAFAEDGSTLSYSVYTGDTTKVYNPSRRVTVTLSLRDIFFGDGDGISAFEFDLYFDADKVAPVYTAATDSDGDAGDFKKLISQNPAAWEAFGTVDSTKGVYSLVFSDNSGSGTMSEDDALIIKIPFLVNSDVMVDDLVFSFKNVVAYNKDMQKKCEVSVDDIVVYYSAQPAINVGLPSDIIPLNYAGYKHDISNFIYYAEKATTVNSFVRRYCSNTANQVKLSTFGILIAGTDGVITYVDTKVSSTSNKSSVTIPAGSYIIGVSSGNADDFAAFKAAAKVGQQVTVYNVNIEGTGNTIVPTKLNRAGFIIDKVGVNPPIEGGNDPSTPIEPSPDPDNPVDGVLGDVNRSGAIDMMDYILLKRNYFGTFKFDDEQLALGDVNKSGAIDMMDYILLKRAYFGTFKLDGASA